MIIYIFLRVKIKIPYNKTIKSDRYFKRSKIEDKFTTNLKVCGYRTFFYLQKNTSFEPTKKYNCF